MMVDSHHTNEYLGSDLVKADVLQVCHVPEQVLSQVVSEKEVQII